jgi:RNA polymerase sigma factor (sigma-70 family)
VKQIARLLALVLSLCLIPGMPLPRSVQADPRIIEHLPLVRAMARKFLPRMGGLLELDDLVSIGLAAMWSAAPEFDASRGVTFGQFAQRCIWSALRNQQREIWKEHRRGWLEQTSIHPKDDDDRGIQLPSPWPDPERAYSAFELASAVVGTATGRDRELLRQLCLGETLADAGKDAGVSRQRAHEIQEKAFRVVRRQVERKAAKLERRPA